MCREALQCLLCQVSDGRPRGKAKGRQEPEVAEEVPVVFGRFIRCAERVASMRWWQICVLCYLCCCDLVLS